LGLISCSHWIKHNVKVGYNVKDKTSLFSMYVFNGVQNGPLYEYVDGIKVRPLWF